MSIDTPRQLPDISDTEYAAKLHEDSERTMYASPVLTGAVEILSFSDDDTSKTNRVSNRENLVSRDDAISYIAKLRKITR